MLPYEILLTRPGLPGPLADENQKETLCPFPWDFRSLQHELSLLRILEDARQRDEHSADIQDAR